MFLNPVCEVSGGFFHATDGITATTGKCTYITKGSGVLRETILRGKEKANFASCEEFLNIIVYAVLIYLVADSIDLSKEDQAMNLSKYLHIAMKMRFHRFW